MNLTLHLIRTDLVRMRLWIACWVGVLLAPIVIGAALLARGAFPDEHWRAPNTLAILTGAQILVGYLLTILLIHEHPLIGTTQFWLTRPISRGRLLVAKFSGALMIVALIPVTVALPWWLWSGFGPREIAHAATETVVVMFVVIVCGAVMATITESFGRALLWTVVFVGVGLFAMFFFAIVNAQQVRDSHSMSVMLTRSVTAVIAVLFELIAVIAAQFLLRRRGWWLGVAAAAIVATLLLALQSPWSWFEEVDPPEVNASRASGITAKIESAHALPPRRSSGTARLEPDQSVDIRGVLSGVEVDPQFTVHGVAGQHQWTLPGGLAIGRKSTPRVLTSDIGPAPKNGFPISIRASLPRSIVARLNAEPSTYETRLWFRLLRLERWFEGPLAPGPWHAHGSRRFKVLAGSRQGDGARVEFVETSPYLLRYAFPAMSRFRSWATPIMEHPGFVIIDHDREELRGLSGRARHVIIYGVAIYWHDAQLPRRGSRVLWSRLPRSLASANSGLTFVAFNWRIEAQFAREVKVDRFQLEK